MSGRWEEHACPVCGKHIFKAGTGYDICPVCGWADDPDQREMPDEEDLSNAMSLNEAREAYKQGKPIY